MTREHGIQPDRLAIVVPLYNPGRFLREVLQNLVECARALREPVDIFLTDDGTEDYPGVSDIVGAEEWTNVTYWENPQNLGESANVNNAMQRLRDLGYKFALLLHQDDLISPSWLQFCVTRARDETDANGQLWFCRAVIADIDKADDSGFPDTPVAHLLEIIQHRGLTAIEAICRDFLWMPSGTLFHIKSFLEIGGFYNQLKYCADGDFGVRWLCKGFSMNEMPYPLCYRRLHENQTTHLGVYSGIADQGYAYIMIRYRNFAGLKRRFREHFGWLRRKISIGWRCAKSLELRRALGQAAAIRIVFASLMTCISPRFTWLLPHPVRELLENAPPGYEMMPIITEPN